ncbi:6-bladed beta-propeller [Paracoccus sp. Z330]|uniref:6-bladed beta-propeller n=1 Tax=Paracoccus onchidii TaxID=3017813 RepID=A0ABT4ZHC1_9RHOB|nr:6-bladed beta-propeller [Paracoccus onchidii]MDB6178716.1 6-bladed beta-propeller [Paracoccus onchidii]
MTTSPPASRYVALGNQRYHVQHLDLGDGLTGISDLAVHGERVIALRRQAPELAVLEPAMALADHPLRQITCGHGLRALGPDMLAATDMDGHKVVFLNARLIETARLHCDERPGLGRPFNHPTDCTRGRDGRIYVADGYGNSAVHVFDPTLRHQFSFGNAGTGPGQFSTPHSILCDPQGRICVADRENNRVQRFDPEGIWLDEIGGLHKPMALALGVDGNLLVTDQTPRLSAYDPDGQLTGRCRTFATYAHGMDVAPDGTIYLAEMMPDRITALIPTD